MRHFSQFLLVYLFVWLLQVYPTGISKQVLSYFNNPGDWIPGDKPQLLEDTVRWSNKRLAHMTKQRLDQKPTINFHDLSRILDILLDKFIKFAPTDRISDELRDWGNAQQYNQ